MVAPVGRQGILSLTIKDKSALYAAYMPFIKNGGLFIPTNKTYGLGDEVFMLLTLMEETEKLPVAGKIIWVTPKGAQGNRAAGIGVQFSDQDGGAVRTGFMAAALPAAMPVTTRLEDLLPAAEFWYSTIPPSTDSGANRSTTDGPLRWSTSCSRHRNSARRLPRSANGRAHLPPSTLVASP